MQLQFAHPLQSARDAERLFSADDAQCFKTLFTFTDLFTKRRISWQEYGLHARRFSLQLLHSSSTPATSNYRAFEQISKQNRLWEPYPSSTPSTLAGVDWTLESPVTLMTLAWLLQLQNLRATRMRHDHPQTDWRGCWIRFMVDVSAALDNKRIDFNVDPDDIVLRGAASLELERRRGRSRHSGEEAIIGNLSAIVEGALYKSAAQSELSAIMLEMRQENAMLSQLLALINSPARFLTKNVLQILMSTALIHSEASRDDRPQSIAGILFLRTFRHFLLDSEDDDVEGLLRAAGNILQVCHSGGRSAIVLDRHMHVEDVMRTRLTHAAMFLLYRALYWVCGRDLRIISGEMTETAFACLLDRAVCMAEPWTVY